MGKYANSVIQSMTFSDQKLLMTLKKTVVMLLLDMQNGNGGNCHFPKTLQIIFGSIRGSSSALIIAQEEHKRQHQFPNLLYNTHCLDYFVYSINQNTYLFKLYIICKIYNNKNRLGNFMVNKCT